MTARTMLREYRRRIEAVMAAKVPHPDSKKTKNPQPWRLVAERATDYSYQFAYAVPNQYSRLELEGQVDAFYATCGAIIEFKDRAGIVEIHVYPNDMPALIPFRPDMLTLTSDRTLLLGFDRQLQPVTHDFRVPHGLFAGQSGYGKTELVKWLVLQLISRYSPDDIEIQIIDLKQTSFKDFRGIPHITRIARDLATATNVLAKAHAQMLTRGNAIWESDDGETRYKLLLVIIDEGAQISPSQQSTKEDRELANIAWKAAGALACVGRELQLGIWFCTQRPDATSINPQVKSNVDTKVCFKTVTRTNSEIVLDRGGAEQLPENTPGRAIYATTSFTTFQAPFIDKHDWPRILAPYKTKGGAPTHEPRSEAPGDTRPSGGSTDILD